MNRRPRGTPWRFLFIRCIYLCLDLAFFIPLALVSLCSRLATRRIDVGLGPLPIINAEYHKRALLVRGFTAETFVDAVWHQTMKFDFRGDKILPGRLKLFRPYVMYVRSIWRYRCIYTYFNGGALRDTAFLYWGEVLLLQLAGVKTVVMPYGSDVQDITFSTDRTYVHRMAVNYPQHRFIRGRIRRNLGAWTMFADHIISGCDWVDYMHYWDTLMISHFAIDMDEWKGTPTPLSAPDQPLRVLHAPNHRALKGTDALMRAIDELRAEGIVIELTVVEGKTNDVVRTMMANADLVVDQLVIGWYAMFAIEAMSMGKPVVCYIRDDLKRVFVVESLLEAEELPLINADLLSIKQCLRELAQDRDRLAEIGARGSTYVERHHSLHAIGQVFEEINRSLGIAPQQQKCVH